MKKILYFLLGVLLLIASIAAPMVIGLFLGYGGIGLVGVSILVGLISLPLLIVPWLIKSTPIEHDPAYRPDETSVNSVITSYHHYAAAVVPLLLFALLLALSFSPLGFVSPLVLLSGVIGVNAAIGVIATGAAVLFAATTFAVLRWSGQLPRYEQIKSLFATSNPQPLAELQTEIAKTPTGAGLSHGKIIAAPDPAPDSDRPYSQRKFSSTDDSDGEDTPATPTPSPEHPNDAGKVH